MNRQGGIRVDRARLHGAVSGDRERLTDALDSISLGAIGLSPQAVLIVRRLAPRAPLARHGAAASFVLGVQEELRRRVAGARRGRHGGDNEDLLFEDDAEFEAALVEDWLEGGGRSAGRWWSQVIEESSPVLRWRRRILTDPGLFARTVARLAQRSDAAAWLASFEQAELLAAARGVLETHGGSPAATAALAAEPFKGEPRDLRASLAELAAIAPEAMRVSRQDVAVAMAVASVVVRRPAWVGTQAFARSLTLVAQPLPPTAAARLAAEPAPQNDGGPVRPASERAAAATARATRSRTARRRGSRPGPTPPLADPKTSVEPVAFHASSRRRTEPATDPSVLPTVSTAFGGLFFLLNVFLALGLYGDFTRPADGIKGLSPYELLLLLARRWFGASFETDPLAQLLRELAGLQPGERPGRLFEAPVWSVPEAWLRPWPDVAREGRGPGFTLADDPRRSQSAAWRRRRWVDCLARYLQARLGRALGEKSGRTAVLLTCRQPGRITREHDRIEVHFPLADHPIALRLAGVDRDPGWIPAAGHFIEFRFV